MTLININALGVTLRDPLFSDVNLTLGKGDRLGVVAANGRGKTTLLNCIAGTFEPTFGEITRARGTRVGYMTQNLPQFDELTSKALDQPRTTGISDDALF